jgi:hypothetical protein
MINKFFNFNIFNNNIEIIIKIIINFGIVIKKLRIEIIITFIFAILTNITKHNNTLDIIIDNNLNKIIKSLF